MSFSGVRGWSGEDLGLKSIGNQLIILEVFGRRDLWILSIGIAQHSRAQQTLYQRLQADRVMLTAVRIPDDWRNDCAVIWKTRTARTGGR